MDIKNGQQKGNNTGGGVYMLDLIYVVLES